MAFACRKLAIAESVFPACQARTPSLNTGTHRIRRHASMSSLHSGASAAAFANAESAPTRSLLKA